MGAWKRLLMEQQEAAQNGWRETDFDLAAAAKALKGEIVGERTILCASPRRPPDDRSCEVRFTWDGRFYVYACDGQVGAAYAMVWRALGQEAPPRRDRSDEIARIWAETIPAPGTLVETYLRSRGITLEAPPSLRFHPALWHKQAPGGAPAMVAERLDARGVRVAIHRTYLRPDGLGKAGVDPVKMDLGPCAGTAIRLAPAAEELVVGEGIETTFSFMRAAGLPGWAAGSCWAMRVMELPPEVLSVVIAADGETKGRRAAQDAAARWMNEGREVEIYHAPEGRDFNDLLMEATT